MRSVVALIALTIAAIYGFVAISPAKREIGRNHPEIASIFSPLLFNFSSEYRTGAVLGFRLGSSRQDVFNRLKKVYAGRGDLLRECRVSGADSLVPLTRDLDIAAVDGHGPRLCVFLDSGSLSLDFRFRGDFVSEIDVIFVRTEGP